MFASLVDAVRNRWAYHTHWPTANYAYLAELARRTDSLPPAIKPLFLQLVAGSYLIVEALLSPVKGRHRLIKKNVFEVSAEQFHALHHLIIWTLLSTFVQLNPQSRGSMIVACSDFLGVTSRDQKLFRAVADLPKIDVGAICAALWPELLDILQVESQDTNSIQWVLLTPHFSGAFSQAMVNYKNQLAKLQET